MAGFILAFGIGCTGAGSGNNKDLNKESNGMTTNTYPVIFADAGRSSFINAGSESEGYLTWKKFFDEEDKTPLNPRAILIGGKRIIVYSNDKLIGYDTDGMRLWSKPMREESPLSIHKDQIYFRKTEAIDELAAVDFNGREIQQTMWILESDNACSPLYIEPLDSGFFALCLCSAPPEQGRPGIVFYKKRYETEKFIWSGNIPGRPAAPPLHIAEGDKFIVFSEKEVIVYNAAAAGSEGEVVARFPLPFQEIFSCSGVKDSLLYMLGNQENKIFLAAIAMDGTEKWRFKIDGALSGVLSKQPPVIGVDDLIHIPAGRTLKTIHNGQLVREFTIEERTIDHCTALADGSVLITAKNSLYRADASGQKIYGLLFDHDITTPPVVDAQGHVYIATAFELMRID
ncbi:MAG: hypothetical protein AB1746_02725 [Candidatus Zixiibacteriota bacterium]